MKKSVYITWAETITPLGPDLDSLYDGLMDNVSGISRLERFSTKPYASPYAACIKKLDPDRSRSLILQLADMLIEQMQGVEENTLLITASTKAGIDQLDENLTQKDAPIPETLLMSGLTEYMARKLNLKNSGININSACASSTIAIARGASLIAAGCVDAVLVCSMDTISEFVFSGFSALGAMSEKPAKPFDINRNGLTLGEGAASIMLMNEKKAKEQAAPLLAKVTGWGAAGDATHLTAPARNASGLKQAIKTACTKAETTIDKIQAVSTHGTGTVYNDAMELTALNDLFGEKHIAGNSIKGAIGHTLGAAGGIEAALCVKMLEKRALVPTIGLSAPEKGAISIISSEAQPLKGRHILTTNSGFGGINAALLMEGLY